MTSRLHGVAQRIQEGTTNIPRLIANPGFIERRVEAASTIGQWLAAFFLLFIIPITVLFFRTFHSLLILLFLRRGPGSEYEQVPLLVTFVTFGALIFMIWFWFQWTRTAGFGILNVQLERGE